MGHGTQDKDGKAIGMVSGIPYSVFYFSIFFQEIIVGQTSQPR